MSAPTSNSISDCTEFYIQFWCLKLFFLAPLVMPNMLLEFSMVFLPQMSLAWHLVFMFFLPPPPHPIIHTSLFLNCCHFIYPWFYTYSHFFASFLHPLPIVSQTLPPYPHFRFFVQFMVALATINISHYLISNYIVSYPPAPG